MPLVFVVLLADALGFALSVGRAQLVSRGAARRGMAAQSAMVRSLVVRGVAMVSEPS